MERIGETSAKSKLLSGAFLLTLSTLLVKLSGLVYKIPMLSILGTEGMGYFNSAYELYTLIVSAATAGLPVALSVLLSDALAKGEIAKAKQIDRTALFLCALIGLLGSASLALFAKRFCLLIQNPNAYHSILAIAPTMLFTCLAASFRGYFQGRSRMGPTALSQLGEAIFKLLFGLIFATLSKSKGDPVEQVAASAGWGLSLGSALTCFALALAKAKAGKEERGIPSAGDPKEILFAIARLSLPIALGVSLTGATRILDMAMILRRLQSIGIDAASANRIYGSYTTLSLSVYGLLPSLVSSVCLPLVPLISEAVAKKETEREEALVREGFRLIALFGIPGALGLAAFSGEILSLLFAGQYEAVAIASPLLSCLGISSFLSCMIGGIQSVLHARKIVVRPLLAMLFGAILKSVSAYLLIGSPKIAILGAPISTFLCNLSIVLLGMLLLLEGEHREPVAKIFFAPLLPAVCSIGGFAMIFSLLPTSLRASELVFLCGFLIALPLYFGLSFWTGAIRKEDFFKIALRKHKKV